MASREQSDSVNIRIETGQPRAERLSMHITPKFAEEIAVAFEGEGGHVTHDVIELSVSELIETALEVAGPIAVSGATVAKILKEWWHRNDGKKVAVTINGVKLSLEGMSVEEMSHIIDQAREQWDDRWRRQFPERFQATATRPMTRSQSNY